MAVVAATVHQARLGRLVPEFVVLRHRQRIHVGTQADHAAAVAAFAADDAHHAGLANSAMHLDSKRLKRTCDDPGRPDLFEAKLGMGMQVAPQRRQFVMEQAN